MGECIDRDCDECGPSWDDVEVGDRVTWEMTGTVVDHELGFRRHSVKIGEVVKGIDESRSTLKSVEKPVRTFKPGDRVRYKTLMGPGYEFTLAENGYFDHSNNLVVRDADTSQFMSNKYELVED